MPASNQARLGRYILFKSLKKGGMARVFLAIDPDRPDELLAIKTLLPKLRKDRMYREMFVSEGKVGLRLQHPNIVRTIESGTDRGGPFIAMEFIFGFDVSTVMRQLRKESRDMPVPLAVALARDVAAGLDYAHALTDEHERPLEIVNRDVSPGNIMVGFDGRIQLIDFGIAQTTIDVKSQIGSIKGKISYMAPEQVRGLPVDHRVDLFGLGTTLYEMLTGVQPFHAEGDFATMEKVRRAEADPPSSINKAVDADLDGIIARAMAREAHDRHFSAGLLSADLDRWLTERGEVVDATVFEGFMRSLFEKRIEEMNTDISNARSRALGDPSSIPPGPVSMESGSLRLISEDMLAEFADLASEADPPAAWRSGGGDAPAAVEPEPPAPTGGRSMSWVLAALAVIAVGGLIWAFSGGV